MTEHLTTQQLNESLKIPAYYESVFVLVIYWEEADDPGYKREAEKIAKLFDEDFGFTIEKYAIPTVKSELELDGRIFEAVKACTRDSLLIVHYGGHGDPDPGKLESVWTANRNGKPDLRWSTVQAKLHHADGDVLLLLDCCYAGQAARRRRVRLPPRVELLAASAMNVEAVEPGRHSFTTALIRELQRVVENKKTISVEQLHRKLADATARLQESPFHVALSDNDRKSIRLRSLRPEHMPNETEESAFLLRLQVRMRDEPSLEDVVMWLRKEAPSCVSDITAQDIVPKMAQLGNFFACQGSQPSQIFNRFPPDAKSEIERAYEHVLPDFPVVGSRLQEFIRRFGDRLSGLLGMIGKNIMTVPHLDQMDSLREAVEDENIQQLGCADSLKMRLMALFPSESASMFPSESPDSLKAEESSLGRVHLEYKYYGTVENQSAKRISNERVKQLAGLLQASKSPEFCSLTCQKWFDDHLDNRYGLVFTVPEHCSGKPVRLHEIINDVRFKRYRPTLGQRYRLAHQIGQAIQKWHSVCWVHQNISSHNILFFRRGQDEQPDYSAPYLCGFEYARETGGVSLPRTIKGFSNNVYRHPDRQGSPTIAHKKVHDLYSYGVVLYEIGYWKLVEGIFTSTEKNTISPRNIAQKISTQAKLTLGHYMGSRFEKAAISCLTGSFDGAQDDSVGSPLANEFQKKVLEELAVGLALD